jgi:hypothetical protein
MNPHPQSITRTLATARAPPPGGSFVRNFPATGKNSSLRRPLQPVASPSSVPFTLQRFLNQPWLRYAGITFLVGWEGRWLAGWRV